MRNFKVFCKLLTKQPGPFFHDLRNIFIYLLWFSSFFPVLTSICVRCYPLAGLCFSASKSWIVDTFACTLSVFSAPHVLLHLHFHVVMWYPIRHKNGIFRLISPLKLHLHPLHFPWVLAPTDCAQEDQGNRAARRATEGFFSLSPFFLEERSEASYEVTPVYNIGGSGFSQLDRQLSRPLTAGKTFFWCSLFLRCFSSHRRQMPTICHAVLLVLSRQTGFNKNSHHRCVLLFCFTKNACTS